MENITLKAHQIRDVIRYIKTFKDATCVIYLDDKVISSSMFPSLIADISLIFESGIKVVIIPGCRKRINEILSLSNITWKMVNSERITDTDAMNLIQMAAFDVSNTIMTSLTGEKKSSVIGNWVKARGKGIINGIDYKTTGKIESIDIDSINAILKDKFIPILPCIGWSATGKPYNISSLNLATEVAQKLNADKLFFILPETQINPCEWNLPQEITLSENNNIPALNITEVKEVIEINKNVACDGKSNKQILLTLFELAKDACSNGVSRVHILDGSIDGILPCEIFSGIGSGTMIYKDDYSAFRSMQIDDVSKVLSLIDPFVKSGILLPRTKQSFTEKLDDYTVYQVDGTLHACGALHLYNNNGILQAEIACIAVEESYSKLGIGLKLINYLILKAKKKNVKTIFVLTTQSADWFERLGFKEDEVSSLPEERKNLWSKERNSKVLKLDI